MSSDKDTLRDEYPEHLIRSGVRGKYTNRYREGTNIVLIDPDLHKLFPDPDAVNRALREYASKRRTASETKPPEDFSWRARGGGEAGDAMSMSVKSSPMKRRDLL